MQANLATDKAPPLSVPLRFFLVTSGAFALLQAGLLWWAQPLATGHFLGLQAVTLTHLFTLGFGSMVVMGALYQLLPVILARNLVGVRLARWQFWLYASGATVLIAGFGLYERWLIVGGGLLTLLGAWLFVGIALMTIRRARQPGQAVKLVTRFVRTALWYFGLTVAWGLLLALNLRFQLFPAGHIALLIGHAGIGLIGWFGLLVSGVSYVLLPMFYLCDDVSEAPGRWVLRLLATGAGLLGGSGLVGIVPGAPGATALAAVMRSGGSGLVTTGLLLFLLDQIRMINTRKRKAMDVTLRYTFAAWSALLLAVVVAIGAFAGVWQPAAPSRAVLTVAWLGLGGWLTLMIVGQLYKILPFLVWFHRFGATVGRERVPLLREMYRVRQADVGWWLIVPGLCLVALGLALGHVWLIRTGAVLGLAGAGLFLTNMGQVLLTGR